MSEISETATEVRASTPVDSIAPSASPTRMTFSSLLHLRHYLWALATPMTMVGVALVTNSVASRVLGAAGFGRFAAAMATIALLTPAMGLGMPVALVRFCGASSSRLTTSRDTYRALAWRLVLGGSVLLGGSLVALQVLLPSALASWVPARTALAIAGAAAGAALVEMAAAEAQLTLRFQRYFARSAGASLLRLLGLLTGLLVSGGSVTAGLFGYGAGSLFAGLVAGRRGITDAIRSSFARTGAATSLRELGAFAAPVVGSAFVIAAATYVDTLIVAAMLPPSKVGAYAAAVRLTSAQSAIIAGLSTLALPLAARAIANGTERLFVSRTLWLAGPTGVLVTAVACALSVPLIRLIYGNAFPESASIFVVVAIGILLNFLGNPLSSLLYAGGHSGYMFRVQLLQLAALAIGLAAVTTRWGIMGAALYKSAVNVAAVSLVIVRVIQFARAGARQRAEPQAIPPWAA